MTEQEWSASDDPVAMLAFLLSQPWIAEPPRLDPDTDRARLLVSDRKLRLFACGCCRLVWPLLTDSRSRNAVEVAERYADGLAARNELLFAERDATAAADFRSGGVNLRNAAAYCCAPEVTETNPLRQLLWNLTDAYQPGYPGSHMSPAAQAALLRDVVGNPFRPATPLWKEERLGVYDHPIPQVTWLTPTTLALAGAAYGERECRWCRGSGDYEGPHGKGRKPCPDCLRGTALGPFDASVLPILADALEDAGADDQQLLGHLRGGGVHARGCWAVDLLLGKE